jgi:RNA-directed DNA polymerase
MTLTSLAGNNRNDKPFTISKQLVLQAYKQVKANAGSAGVDEQSLKDFDKNLKDNLYKIWNRLSSGTYFPPAVKAVEIPKKDGKVRILGIPTVGDRVAQMVVKLTFEPKVEKMFLPDSYGYRPNKSALDAVGITRTRCWKQDWVLEFDIKGLFDNIPHDLLIKAVNQHTQCKWTKLYIKRWLTAPMQDSKGNTIERSKGVPQGGVISPILANLFLHYVFDKWITKNYPQVNWCRYADDGLVHTKTKEKAEKLLEQLTQRFNECGLQIHPDKTKIIYCKDGKRKQDYKNISFDFLGYTFRARTAKSKNNNIFMNFSPAVSKVAAKTIGDKTRSFNWHLRSDLELKDIAELFNPILRGWINYYGKYRFSQLSYTLQHFTRILVKWAMRKYKRFRGKKTEAIQYLKSFIKNNRNMFAHWQFGITKVFV